MNEEQFTQQVDHVLHNDDDPTTPQTTLGKPESTVVIEATCTASQRQCVMDVAAKFAKKEGLGPVKDNLGRILELWAAIVDNEIHGTGGYQPGLRCKDCNELLDLVEREGRVVAVHHEGTNCNRGPQHVTKMFKDRRAVEV